MTQIRLNKFLADAGVSSRRKAEQFILDGEVTVNGEVIDELGTKVDSLNDKVEFNGEIVEKKDNSTVLMLNKPMGYTCTTRHFKGEKNVLSLIKTNERLYPVGRLDKESEGLLILTNNGDLANKLMHPRYEKDKEYVVEFIGDASKVGEFARLETLDEEVLASFRIKQLTQNKFSIVLHEGKKRQIRRMCAEVGLKVVNLQRTRVNKLKLSGLKSGESRQLTDKEIEELTK